MPKRKGSTAAEIVKATNHNPDSVDSWLKKLFITGLVTVDHSKPSRYLPADGALTCLANLSELIRVLAALNPRTDPKLDKIMKDAAAHVRHLVKREKEAAPRFDTGGRLYRSATKEPNVQNIPRRRIPGDVGGR